jgi:parallel beta-helix repeat protein
MIIINKSSGIILESSNNNTISDNDIKSSSRFGIQLSKSYDNKFFNNNFQNNKVGVYGWQARGNQLFSNNFIENDDDGFWNSSATYPMNISNSIGMEFVLIPREYAKAFYMSKYEVTQKQWREIMGNNPSKFAGDELPVESVSWNGVQEFIKKLNEKENTQKYRIPSNAEWGYAASAGSSTIYNFGGDESKSKLGDYAWYNEN